MASNLIASEEAAPRGGAVAHVLRRGLRRALAAGAAALLAVLAFPVAAQTTFTSASPFTIPTGVGLPIVAIPYPTAGTCSNGACITVSGLTGTISKVSLKLTGFAFGTSADSSANLAIALQSPNGATFDLLTNACVVTGGVTFTLSDDGVSYIDPGTNCAFNNGTFKASANHFPVFVADNFPAPGPGSSGYQRAEPDSDPSNSGSGSLSNGLGTFAHVFNGASPNGVWRLYVTNQAAPTRSGSISGWSLTITTAGGAATTTALSASSNPSSTGSPVTLTAAVSSTGTVNQGSVTFTDTTFNTVLGTVPVNASGVATLSNVAGLVEGTHVLKAAYSGSGAFDASEGTLTQRVNNPTVRTGTTYCNSASGIALPATGTASGPGYPYPSNISIANQPGLVSAARIELKNYANASPSTLHSLVVGPCQTGTCALDFFSAPFAGNAVNGIDLTFDDTAASLPGSGTIAAGSYKPLTGSAVAYPAPAPAGYASAGPIGVGTLGSVFGNSNPNGTWSLYTAESTSPGGAIGGWCVDLTIAQPVLSVTKTHTGPGAGNAFVVGQNGSYTITVANAGPGATNGATVTLDDPMPAGMTVNSVASGNDWNCTTTTSTHVVCTTTTARAAGTSWSTLTVSVTPSVQTAATVTNTATASGFSMTTGTGADGPTAVIHTPILSLSNTDNGNPLHTFKQGDNSRTVTFTLSNDTAANHAGDTQSPVTVGITPSSASALQVTSVTLIPGWNCQVVPVIACTSTSTPALAAGASASFTFTFNVAADAPSQLSFTAIVSGGGGNTPTSTDTLTILQVPASISATAGTPQSTTVNTAFATALSATVLDAGNAPVQGASVTFTAPGSGASGRFSNSNTSIVAVTNASGVATAPITANTIVGAYDVSATAGALSASFALTNTASAPASMTANSGTTPQSATVGTAFAVPLAVTIKDGFGNVVPGASVTFTAPASGASGVFANSGNAIVVPTDASGVASAPFTANATLGGPYSVVASASGVSNVAFTLGNVQRTISGTTGSNTGTATMTMTSADGGPACGFTGGGFVPLSSVPVSPPATVSFPQGLVDIRIGNCTPGFTATVHVVFPQGFPPGSTYWKYGPQSAGAPFTWYSMPGAVVGTNDVTLTLKDGQLGDDDFAANGAISDPGGAAVAVSLPVPALDDTLSKALLALLLTALGAHALRRARRR